jgi:pimeloyl-ACP methyl ester carboxylesterase
MTVHKHEVHIDVSGSTDIPGELSVAMSVFTPEPEQLALPATVLFAYPGGGFTRGYFDLELPEPTGYSEARYHAEHGWIVVTVDHLGVGGSSLADDPQSSKFLSLTLDKHAAAHDAAAREVLARLEKGTLVEGLPAVRGATVLGMGQSMGGCFLTTQQGVHHTFDGVALLGWGNTGVCVEGPPGTLSPVWPSETLTIEEYLAQIGAIVEYAFYGEFAPESIREAERGYPVRNPPVPWGTPNIPVGPDVTQAVLPGSSTMGTPLRPADAAAIDVPVFIGVGERDVIPALRAEPTAYPKSTDIQLFVLPDSAHMHNFSKNRSRMWDRVHAWGTLVTTSRNSPE